MVQVAATDSDQGDFGSITYSIVDGPNGKFYIDNITGWINTTSELDRETTDNYVLIVRAADGKEILAEPQGSFVTFRFPPEVTVNVWRLKIDTSIRLET